MDEDEIEEALEALRSSIEEIATGLSLFEDETRQRLSMLTEERSAISGLITQLDERLQLLEARR
ncbi:MAG: hypothetical protein Q8K13_10450 [Parvibaculum sp.]|uniref:hypothetical protein n=1 Tax=Parvibaculum sp. TaxID=2024848 RepID=UPI0027312CEF|nr:hypothetical protein [Parvibaculum sp.]MDP2150048.1 hypothetical protein [Parvibaculum sp.]